MTKRLIASPYNDRIQSYPQNGIPLLLTYNRTAQILGVRCSGCTCLLFGLVAGFLDLAFVVSRFLMLCLLNSQFVAWQRIAKQHLTCLSLFAKRSDYCPYLTARHCPTLWSILDCCCGPLTILFYSIVAPRQVLDASGGS